MKSIRKILIIVPLVVACNPFVKSAREVDPSRLESISLPDGFKISVFAEEVEDARSLALGNEGTVFVGSRRAGKVYAITDSDGDFRADRVLVVAEGLDSPNGVAFHAGDLYVAEISRVIRFPGIEKHLENPPEPEIIRDDFPTDDHHGWKYIAFGPDGKLYVPVGAPCNNCLSDNEIYASITRMDADGGNHEIFARGVRNTVGFDWHPQTGELWFTDNGRDWLGDDRPPDELNHAPVTGMHFGYPFCHGTDISDPEFGDRGDCSNYTPPVSELGPHVAALGMLFYTGDLFPAEYSGRVFIAEHGSWNRTDPIGYRITTVELNSDGSAEYSVFAEGWLQDGRAWGRPVDILQLPDGSLLVSDDAADVIYRIH